MSAETYELGDAMAVVRANEAATEAEYGTYRALVPIDINGGRAFNPGDPVPVSHVTRGVVAEEQVAKLTTKAGRAAAGLPEKKD